MADSLREIRGELADLRKQVERPSQRSQLTAKAREDAEHPDPTPMELPTGLSRPESIQDMIRSYIRTELSQTALKQEFGTFEEEDDFTEDDFDQLPASLFEIAEYELEADREMPELPADASNLESQGDSPSEETPAAQAIPSEGTPAPQSEAAPPVP